MDGEAWQLEVAAKVAFLQVAWGGVLHGPLPQLTSNTALFSISSQHLFHCEAGQGKL